MVKAMVLLILLAFLVSDKPFEGLTFSRITQICGLLVCLTAVEIKQSGSTTHGPHTINDIAKIRILRFQICRWNAHALV